MEYLGLYIYKTMLSAKAALLFLLIWFVWQALLISKNQLLAWLIFSIFLLSISLIFALIITSFLMLALGFNFPSFSNFLRWKLRLLMLRSFFFPNICVQNAINFPLSATFTVYHNFWWFIPSVSSKCFKISLEISFFNPCVMHKYIV